jgi:hypothetical protein
MTKVQLEGIYQISGSKLIDQEKPFVLILDQRKNVTSSKTPTFLVAKSTTGTFNSGKKDQYISSVYPVPGETFSKIEYQGIYYKFEMIQSQVIIEPFSQMALNNNSHL